MDFNAVNFGSLCVLLGKILLHMTRLLNTKENRVFPGVDKKLFQYGPEVTLPLSVLNKLCFDFPPKLSWGWQNKRSEREDFVNSLFSPPSFLHKYTAFDPPGNNWISVFTDATLSRDDSWHNKALAEWKDCLQRHDKKSNFQRLSFRNWPNKH